MSKRSGQTLMQALRFRHAVSFHVCVEPTWLSRRCSSCSVTSSRQYWDPSAAGRVSRPVIHGCGHSVQHGRGRKGACWLWCTTEGSMRCAKLSPAPSGNRYHIGIPFTPSFSIYCPYACNSVSTISQTVILLDFDSRYLSPDLRFSRSNHFIRLCILRFDGLSRWEANLPKPRRSWVSAPLGVCKLAVPTSSDTWRRNSRFRDVWKPCSGAPVPRPERQLDLGHLAVGRPSTWDLGCTAVWGQQPRSTIKPVGSTRVNPRYTGSTHILAALAVSAVHLLSIHLVALHIVKLVIRTFVLLRVDLIFLQHM